jgi:hypothetical protein
MLLMWQVRALCGSMPKQAHTQNKEEGVQGQSTHINEDMG